MILEQIVEKTKIRLQRQKELLSLDILKQQVEALEVTQQYSFYKALQSKDMSFILEVKKASPSKGLIAKEFDYIEIAKEYERIGASAISVLTEPTFFQGDNQYLKEIKEYVHIPVLRKDFIIDEYMIYEAKQIGADAILLICAILNDQQLTSYIQLAEVLGLSVLVETHNKHEIERAIKANAKIIGVNNRNLKDFTVDFHNSIELRRHVPKHILFVSESGIHTHEDIKLLKQNHVDAVLIGEAIMKSENKETAFQQLRGQYED